MVIPDGLLAIFSIALDWKGQRSSGQRLRTRRSGFSLCGIVNCVTLAKSFHLNGPRFPQLQKEAAGPGVGRGRVSLRALLTVAF